MAQPLQYFLLSAVDSPAYHADHNLLTGEPEDLLELIRSLLGVPRNIDQ
jgi:hypothetical protein